MQGDAAGTVIYGAASCLAAGRNVACFAFLSSDCQTLAVLSANTVKFTDTAATPVIPAKLSPACKPGSWLAKNRLSNHGRLALFS